MSRASLTRLEVESGSSKSLPISFPYYFLDQGDPEDTFNLWQRQEDSLTNISNRKDEHLPSQSPTPQVDTERIDSTKKLNNDEVFNPVPKDFLNLSSINKIHTLVRDWIICQLFHHQCKAKDI